jgi:putative tryptophan/tyrosine transport system substrate-binding protein
MNRRDVITLIAGVSAWPCAALAHDHDSPVIGFLNSAAPDTYTHLVSAFIQGLNEAGFTEGRNVAIQYRWAEGHYDRLPRLAADLVQREVTVIVATGSANSAQAAAAATATIPIVFANGSDPVKLGIVASLDRPGGNATGVSFFHSQLAAKRLELLHQIVPQTSTLAFLMNPKNPVTEGDLDEILRAASGLQIEINALAASTQTEIDAAFATLAQQKLNALLINVDSFFYSCRDQLVALSARQKLPTMYYERAYVAAGGLMSYGSSNANFYRQAGLYAGMILKGAKPADLPVLQPNKFELVINLKTAKTFGIELPLALLTRADEVLE